LEELRRRHVFRVAAWYAAAAWGLIQVASTVIPEFDWPAWMVRAVIIACLAGFPIALLLAWAFDLTTAGIKLTAAAPEEPTTDSPARGLLSLLLAVAAGVLLGVGAITGWQALEAPAARPGIAVLAFDVLGQKANQTLAGGLHEAILDALAHISGLRVIARTSVLRFTGQNPDIRDVGRILDVPYVLEGSVQREGKQLRVHVQLIDAASDAHVWSQTYDRSANDIFGVQTALAKDIAARLRVTLLPAETARAAAAPSSSPAAYASLLHGLTEFDRFKQLDGTEGLPALRGALAAVGQALTLDPEFALAYAERAQMLMWQWWYFRDSEPDAAGAAEQALVAATEALRLAPDLGEAHRALGLYYYWAHLDYASAERELSRARTLLPNDSVSTYILALVRRRQNRFDEATELAREAYHLNPADTPARNLYFLTLMKAGRYRQAETEITDMLARFPEDRDQKYGRAYLEFCRTGDTQVLRQAADSGLGGPGVENEVRWDSARYEGRFADALKIVRASPGDFLGFVFKPLALAESYYDVGDKEAAAAAANVLIDRFNKRLSAVPNELPRTGLADAYLYAGRPDDARRAAQAYLDETPLQKMALDYYVARQAIARVYAVLGDKEKALALLAITQHGPWHACGNQLRRDPAFATLRDNPRFQQLAADSDWK